MGRTCGPANKGRLGRASRWAEAGPSPWTSPLKVISSFSRPFPLSRSPSFHSDSRPSPYPRSSSLWVIYFQSSHLGLRCNLLGLQAGAGSLNSEAWPEWVVPKSIQLIDLPYTVEGRIPCQEQCVIHMTHNEHTWRPSPSRGSVEQLCSSEWLFVGSPCFARYSVS